MIKIRKLQAATEAEICAQMMATSDPWLTLQRDYAASLKFVTDPVREVYLAVNHKEIVGFIVLVMQGAFVGYIHDLGGIVTLTFQK